LITAKECIAKIRQAIKTFGTYSYDDKGPGEVMDMPAIIKAMEDMTGKQIADVLADIRSKYKANGERFIGEVMVDLQGRSDIEDMYEDERISDLF
jgi:hypothetical protein